MPSIRTTWGASQAAILDGCGAGQLLGVLGKLVVVGKRRRRRTIACRVADAARCELRKEQAAGLLHAPGVGT